MAVSSRLGSQLKEIVSTIGATGASFALIGGLALARHKVVRATQDIDLLMDSTMADAVHGALLGLGYVNDPRRTRDLEDIRSLLAANRETVDMDEVREYFRLFGKETLLEDLLD